MNRRRTLLTALGSTLLAAPLATLAQPAPRVWRIGYIDFGSRQSTVSAGRLDALMKGLREVGYVEGKNLVFDARYAEGDAGRVDGFAAELVRQKVDLLLTLGSGASHAARRATLNMPAPIPVVVISSPDPVSEGFAKTLARPGGNMTGMSNGADDTVQKLVELLGAIAPKLSRIEVLTNPSNGAHASLMTSLQAAAKIKGKQVTAMSVSRAEEIDSRFAAMPRERINGVIILADAFLFQQRAQIAALALKQRLPSIYALAGYAEDGGLMNYGADNSDNFHRAAKFVDRIFKGTKPADLPFEQPLRYYLVINGKTAKALGLTLSHALLISADKVIE